jgi:hypothetical protein
LGGLFHLEHDSSSSIGLEEANLNEPKVQIYPNPTSGKFVVELLNLEPNFQIEIYSTLGSKLSEFTLNTISNVIDISSLPNGIYIVYVPTIGKSIKINKQ